MSFFFSLSTKNLINIAIILQYNVRIGEEDRRRGTNGDQDDRVRGRREDGEEMRNIRQNPRAKGLDRQTRQSREAGPLIRAEREG